MEIFYTIKDTLILQSKLSLRIFINTRSAPDFEVNSKWTLSLNPKLTNPK